MGGLCWGDWLRDDIISSVAGCLDWFWDNSWSGGYLRKLAFSVEVDVSDLAGALVSDEEGMFWASWLEGGLGCTGG